MIDVVSFDSWPSKRTREQMRAGMERLVKAPDADHREHFRDWLLSTVQHKERLADTSLDIYLDFICGPVGQASLFQHQVRHYDPKHTNEVAPRYSELGQTPVQLIWGRMMPGRWWIGRKGCTRPFPARSSTFSTIAAILRWKTSPRRSLACCSTS